MIEEILANPDKVIDDESGEEEQKFTNQFLLSPTKRLS